MISFERIIYRNGITHVYDTNKLIVTTNTVILFNYRYKL